MELTRLEYTQLVKFVRSLSAAQFGPEKKLAVAGLDPNGQRPDLRRVPEQILQALLNHLPSGKLAKLSHPVLKAVRRKVKEALLFVRRPLLDPERWPKIVRTLAGVNNARSGLRAGPGGQHYMLHAQGMDVSLGGRHVWDGRNVGDLIIMGRWFEITAAIGQAGGALQLRCDLQGSAGDGGAEYDRMYDPMPGDSPGGAAHIDHMPFYVSCSAGPGLRPTQAQGEVVLDPRGEVVQLVGSAISGFAGGGDFGGVESLATQVIDHINVSSDMVSFAGERAVDAYQQRGTQEQPIDRTIFTVKIGVMPGDGRYVETGVTSLGHRQLLDFTLRALQRCTGGAG